MHDAPSVLDQVPLAAVLPGLQAPVVCVQGLGFVGAAVCVAVAAARDGQGQPAYRVVGVDLPTSEGARRSAALNRGEFPFPSTDRSLESRLRQAREAGNLVACADPAAFAGANVVIVNVPLDVRLDGPALALAPFRGAICAIGRHMRPDALVIVETTVPPGATETIVAPILIEELRRRRLPSDEFRLAHCYERVMPGDVYLDSILGMPRVYAGRDARSADACERFLRSVVDPGRCRLTRLASTTASELGKVLENTYRAVTIALMEEFAAFAEAAGVDLFDVAASIRARPSHSNMRAPGLGVGGYCLTKDPLLAELGAREVFGLDQDFPLASLAVRINRRAPRRALDRLRPMLGGSLAGRQFLLLGLSYRQDVGDTRHSPSYDFYAAAQAEGAGLQVHDPLVGFWQEAGVAVPRAVPGASGLDAVVLAVPHEFYRSFDYAAWLAGSCPLFLDAFNVLSREQRQTLRALGCKVESVGRGAGL